MSDVAIVLTLVLLGAAALLRGVALISAPWAWIVFGLLCFVLASWPLIRSRLTRDL